MDNPFSNTDSLSRMDFGEINATNVSPVLSTPALHKRRPPKRVRFALTLEPVEENSVPSSPEISPTILSKRTKQSFEFDTQAKPLYGNYIEYLKARQAFKERMSLPTSPSFLETSPEPPTYTHTFVIQSKSPAVFIDSITITTPTIHLPQIVQREKTPSIRTPTTVDPNLKQEVTLSTPPRLVHTKKLSNATNQRHHYVSIQAMSRSSAPLPSTTNLPNKPVRSDNSTRSKPVKERTSTGKIPGSVMTKSPVNALPNRPVLPISLRKPRMPSRLHQSNDEININPKYFFQYHDHDQLLRQPIIHSLH
ncbi:unnamed protein product [Adineta ricciae]|uniref:Uncharacterized protein n=1 Tax=Adineta ricciae TaxID=249248 RepID=A0A813N585_ADIRI|nr:unnamed protein product [Adineta ricciae]CAF1111263.1 unnamed protein product [Adineta ricciae]